ncbi:MurR/RpiR family transcriptional regulator [Streptomyces olivaceus]|uniref:MurR/RpiR family transcriptional regulator n=1 Tax=Streptomyces olivaceus TaxID=47716 RepID=UPI001CCEBAB9|nr:MurR/RpiR family transcriptional regulator [Streptomyces olivaceus]MBZ6226723.1 MurR/RpiR family transcriptional regulator [Streptomyces olivaceus]
MADTPDARDQLAERVRRLAPGLPQALASVAAFVLRHPDRVATASAAELGEATGTSDATVVRTAKALGYSGVKEMRRAATTLISTRADPGAVLAHRIAQVTEESPLSRVVRDSVGDIEALTGFIGADRWEDAVSALAGAERLLVYGMPPVGFVAEHLAFMLRRIGRRATALTATGVHLADQLLTAEDFDAAVVFAPVRQFPEVVTVVRRVRGAGSPCVLITEALDMPVAAEADHLLVTPRSSLDTTGELTLPLVIVQALLLSLAARDRDRAAAAMSRLEEHRLRLAEDTADAHRRTGRRRSDASAPYVAAPGAGEPEADLS